MGLSSGEGRCTDARGAYFFETTPRFYSVQFIPPASLALSSAISNTLDDDTDNNGIQEDTDGDGFTDGLIISPLIELSLGEEPTNETSGPWGNDIDENFNFTIDFKRIRAYPQSILMVN